MKNKKKVVNDNIALNSVIKNSSVERLIADFKRSEGEYPILDKVQERKLIDTWKDTDPDKMRNLLILHNVKIVFNLAKNYASKTSEFDDMVARGLYGLSLAAAKFDPDKNIKFSTYAYNWIFKYVVKEFYDKEFQITSKSLSMDAFPGAETPDNKDFSLGDFLTRDNIEPTMETDAIDATKFGDHNQKEQYRNLAEEISNYVKTSAEFSPLDRELYNSVLVEQEPIRKVAKATGLSSVAVVEKLEAITNSVRNMLREQFGITSFQDVLVT